MSRKGIILPAFIGIFFLVLFTAASSDASFQKVRIHVLGMTCEFCERALEKNLTRVPGVESARAWLDKGTAEVTLKEGARLDIEKLARAVIDGGLTLKDIEVTAKGRLIEQEGKLAFRVGGSNQLIPLKKDEKVEVFLKRASELKLSLKIAAGQIRERLWTVEAIENL
ncbi:MAG: heavy-metal-associated domain-containing protein [Candidatus Binatia bacterium]